MDSENHENKLKEYYSGYYSRVFSYLKSICRDSDTAEDVAQETFIRVQKSLKTFNPEKGSFSTWIRTIAKNLCIRNLKKNSRYDADSEKISLEADQRIGAEDNFIKNSLTISIKKAIECLSEPERSIVYYKYRDNLTLDEIAERAGISRRTVSRKYLSALQQLKEELKSEDFELGN
ncbi:MAG: sigma-70 family RNA polymerase sigma factor [Spirochaetia bacterium]|nr:sigma-70 family RNA polymerase sigma factor [Spirochaetia bacterium]